MKNIDKLIEQLKDKNIHLSLKNGNISVKSTESKISSEITGIIKSNKNEILKYLKEINDYKTFESIYPLSPMQEGMLFHSLYSPNSEVYMTQMCLDFVGQLNISAFITAWQGVIDKHTILRTSFVSDSVSKPLQRVHKFVKCNIEVIDFVEFKEEEIQTKLDTLLENDRINGFDLTKAPLSKFKIIKVSENKHRFIWTHHHILIDGWCLSIIFKEFYENYQTICIGEEIKIENIDKYEDFIYYLEEQDKSKAEEFWKDYLNGFENPTPIPIGHNNQKSDETNVYKYKGITLSIEDTKLLNDFSKEHHLTVNTLVQSAWSLLLSRYSGENDIVFGITVSGRPASLPGVEEKVGLFINTLPLRVKVDGNQDVLGWLKGLQEQQALIREYEYIPLVHIQSLSDVSNRENLLNSILVFENYPIGESGNKENLTLKIENVKTFEKTNYPLTISASIGNNLAINISYNDTIYSTEIIELTLGHFREVLLNIVKHAKKTVSDLEILTSAEKHQLLVEWNDNGADYPKDKCIHQLFEDHARNTPANIAVVFEEEELTYRELNEKSNQLAHYLKSRGVDSDTLVGICVERSLEMIVGLLGILKAGGAYVPIDPTYPQERISYMLEDAVCEIVLSQKHLKLPKTNSDIICLDVDWDKITNEATENVKSAVKSNSLAYVIYTSGSTGKPKGVMIEHRNTVSMLVWAKKNYNANELRGVLASTSINFDLSVFELFLPLATSNTIVLVNNILSYNDSINKGKVSLINTVPSAIKQLISDKLILDSVKVINLAGEKLEQEVVEELYTLKPSLKVFDLYGPSEDTTYSTFSLRKVNGFYTIGRPISNTSIFILTDDLNIVPVGVAGELCISGTGLAQGYLKQHELTAEKFIQNPFSNDLNSRLYKTGDLVRYLPDGNIEFLGRIDNQVKIRGFRIELGEIEATISKIETVKDCLVVAKDDTGGNKRLVAYIVSGDELNVQEIREGLSKSLPDYMVPSLFVSLEKMPLTPNGKIDRKALPEAEGNIETTNEYVAPRNETEQKLAAIWTKVLGIEKVGVYDNFFELGGHSLLAIQIISKIRNEFNIELPLKTLFEEPNLLSFSKIIENTKSGSEIAKIAVASRDVDLPLSFAQERLWFIDQYEHNASYNMPGAVKLIGKLDINVLEKTFSEIIRRHEVLRTNIVTITSVASQLIHEKSKFELKIVDQSHLSEEEANQKILELIEIESQKPFDLANDSLIRLVLYKINDEEHTLFLNKHHIISDGWSFSVFFKEISILYKAFSNNKLSPLPELEIQYADYAVWQREHIEGEVLFKQSEYWKIKLLNTAILELPTDKTRRGEQTFNGGNLHFSLDKDITEKLNTFSKENETTLFMTLLSAFKVLLNKYTGQDDICVGSPIANRTRSEIEPLIGLFVNTLALRSDLSGDISFVDLVKQVKQTTLDAYANQDMPFEKVVDIVQPERNLSYSPLFQVMLVLQNNPASELSFGELSLKPVKFESTVSKFDLTINFNETAKGLVGGIEYNKDLFNKDRIERMTGHFNVLTRSIISNPTVNISELEILSAAEKHKILVEWNDTEAGYPKDKCVNQLFEEQARKTPNNIAVVFEEEELTYRDLNKKSNQLAHYLQSKGVKPDSLVGICVDRSLEMIVGLLGILKAGGAYVPIDPTYPEERISYMLEDAGCEIVLSQEHLKLPETNSEIIYLDADWDKIENEPIENVISEVKSDNLAYVIYTSGSTGKPKGSLIEHINVVRLFFNDKFQFCFSERDVWSLFHSFCFDFSVWEMYGALLYGGKLVVIPKESTKDTLLFLDILEKHKVTILNQTPSIFYNLSDIVERNKTILSLRYVIFGGEALNPSKLKFWYDNYSTCKLINMYGITETTVHVTYKEITGLEINSNICNIGKPISTLSTYILDENQKLLPVGVPGELCVSGAGLSRGYLNNEKFTAAKFQKNPFIQGEKIYQSGDLAYVNELGELIYCGRIDNQVKIRGFRVELGEIESVLSKIGVIKNCVVVAKEDLNGNKLLVAYIVSEDELNVHEIREDLSKSLPDYMVPSLFVSLEKMPLTPNGKINKKALPNPEGNIETTNEYVAPRNDTEQKLAAIWTNVLGIEKVGVYDNFFELGGHSLLATQVISKIRNIFNIELPLKTLFEFTTIFQVSEYINVILKTRNVDLLTHAKKEKSYEI